MTQTQPLIRIIDDDEPFADAIRFLFLSKGWQAVAYTRAEDFFQHDDPAVPGCLILDYRMPELNGIEVQERLSSFGFSLPVIFLTAHADVDMAIAVFKHGALDLLRKPVQPDALLSAAEAAVGKDMAQRKSAHSQADARTRFEQLTRREHQIVKLAAHGLSNHQIAERFGISERTVEAHRSAAYRRLNVKCLEELQAFMTIIGE